MNVVSKINHALIESLTQLKERGLRSSYFKDVEEQIFFNIKEQLDNNSVPYNLDDGDTYVILQPQNTQRFPDIMVAHSGVTLPIEIKTSNKNGIVWNGGLPRRDSVYIFLYKRKEIVTYFLGQDMISDETRKFLYNVAFHLRGKTKEIKKDLWSFYMRAMFNCNDKVIVNTAEMKQREENVLTHLQNLTWNRRQTNYFEPEYIFDESARIDFLCNFLVEGIEEIL